MKLLFDQNLSPRLVRHLHDLFPIRLTFPNWDSIELTIWESGPLRRGNCSTSDVEEILREHEIAVRTLLENEKVGLLTLF